MPALAPWALLPVDPMLLRSLSRAIGSSVAMKLSTALLRITPSRRTREEPGKPRMVWKAKVPKRNREVRPCMMGSINEVLLLARSP